MNEARIRLLRRLPKVDQVLADDDIQTAAATHGWGRGFLREAVNAMLDELRADVLAGNLDEAGLDARLADPGPAVVATALRLLRPMLRPVINATGVVVHTNLGRSPWPAAAAARAASLAGRYLNLEFDLEEGRRGHRDRPVECLMERLFPGTATAVVNNNAAAVLLVLNTFADGREVVVSRGQLVEIGGSFRIPDVMEKGGCRLREVGTTNRTRAADFRAAIGPDTRLLLNVHPSNYRVVGFTESVPLEDLVALGAESGVPVAEDLGSGCIVDLRPFGLADEPTVAERLETGIDVVTFSGDKVLGGPQAGFVVGKPEAVERVRNNPLYRAMRLDKSMYLSIEATLLAYLKGRADEIPVLSMIMAKPEDLRRRAESLALRLETALAEAAVAVEVVDVDSRVGGGAAPEVGLPSTAVALETNVTPDELARRLRQGDPAVVGRIVDDRMLFDVRTLLEGDDDELVRAVAAATG